MLMKSEPEQRKARHFIESLPAVGRYHFDSTEARAALGETAAKFTLSRLAKQGVIASPARGFYVIVPPEYRALRCLPADQFIPALMKKLGLAYYAGLLTAAQYHGAAHHRPQEFQVFLEKPRRVIECGKVRVAFVTRRRLRDVSTRCLNTPRGGLLVSTPEATAVDLVGYQHRAGGLGHVATVLAELAEKIEPEALAAAADTAPLPWAQRLGYLLEQVGASEKLGPLKAYVRARAQESVMLLPNATRSGVVRANRTARSEDWKLCINADVEAEL